MPLNNHSQTILQLQEENRRLKIGIEELAILNEIATAISSTLSLDRIVELIVRKCVKHLNVEQGAVLLLDEEDPDSPFRTMVRKADTSSQYLPFRLDTQLTGWMLKNRKPLVINDLKNDQHISTTADSQVPFDSLLAVPLILKSRMLGLLSVFNKKDEHGFSENDQRLLSIIATQSAQVIENARLYEEEQALFRMQEEMRLASQIQIKLLPKEAPVIPGYDIAGKSIPAKDVGGDYFDFIPINHDRLAICMGDISGKGMPAALLMSNLQATLRAQTLHNLNPSECIRRSNRLLFQITDPEKYATLFYSILDKENNCLCYTNAGHDNPLLLRSDGQIKRFKEGGIVVGFLENFEYIEEKETLLPGDLLLIYTDGITEALTAAEEEYGEERLTQLVREIREEPAAKIIDRIIAEIEAFRRDAPQTDDMTLIVVKKT